jgi:hypothetical protein
MRSCVSTHGTENSCHYHIHIKIFEEKRSETIESFLLACNDSQ